MKKFFVVLFVILLLAASSLACSSDFNSESWESAGGGHINGGGLSDLWDEVY